MHNETKARRIAAGCWMEFQVDHGSVADGVAYMKSELFGNNPIGI
ncbi:hypothetical protein [Sphingopyxis macrogoltabida]|nr:hypothetical protein [Sphingopyxis macrogoltabida]